MSGTRKHPIPNINTRSATRDQLIEHIKILKFKLDEILPKDDQLQALQTKFNISPQQSIILFCLSDGRIWAQGRLVSAAAQWNEKIEPHVIKVQISRLRKKLPKTIEIKTLWGFGYQLERGGEVLRQVNEVAK